VPFLRKKRITPLARCAKKRIENNSINKKVVEENAYNSAISEERAGNVGREGQISCA
jgi:hypothetical protein